jgi:hypothetical protein
MDIERLVTCSTSTAESKRCYDYFESADYHSDYDAGFALTVARRQAENTPHGTDLLLAITHLAVIT